MACMCGDTHCPSCGPAQGNGRCPLCGAWADDGCEHFDAETGAPTDATTRELERLALEEIAAQEEYEREQEEAYWREQEARALNEDEG